MSETKFTPGPWNALIGSGDWGMPITHIVYIDNHPFDGNGEICLVNSIRPYCVGAKENDKRKYIEQKANATLIAAAPDLYEALLRLFEDVTEVCHPDSEWSLFGRLDREMIIPSIRVAEEALAKARGEGV